MTKSVTIYKTANFAKIFAGYEYLQLDAIVLTLFLQYPFDLFIGEQGKTGGFQIRIAGYHFKTMELDEKTIVFASQQDIPTKFWVKIDDYGKYYVMTFLLPSDY